VSSIANQSATSHSHSSILLVKFPFFCAFGRPTVSLSPQFLPFACLAQHPTLCECRQYQDSSFDFSLARVSSFRQVA